MGNKAYSYSIKLDISPKQKIYNITKQPCSNIISNDSLLPFKYQAMLNNVVTEQNINFDNFTTPKKNHPESSSFHQDNNDNNHIKLEIVENSTVRKEIRTLQTTDSELFQKKLLTIMKGENYTSGEMCASEEFVESTIQRIGADSTMKWLMQLYEMNYNHSNILIGILHMLSHFSYSTVNPYGPIMALALLQHRSTAVREFAIKAFENWNSKDSLKILKNIKCDQKWLQNYLNEVIFDIEND